MLLDFLDDVFLLHFALKTPQGIFQGFTLLDNDFSHFINSPPIRFGLVSCGASRRPSCGRCVLLRAPPLVLIIACIVRFAGAPGKVAGIFYSITAMQVKESLHFLAIDRGTEPTS